MTITSEETEFISDNFAEVGETGNMFYIDKEILDEVKKEVHVFQELIAKLEEVMQQEGDNITITIE